MKIESAQFQRIASVVLGARESGFRDGTPPVTALQVEAIIAIAELAVEADGREDADEDEALDALATELRTLVGAGADADDDADVPDDLAELAAELSGPSAELAYVVAYLVTIADLSIEPSEEGFLESVRAALAITEGRADELIDVINASLAPTDS